MRSLSEGLQVTPTPDTSPEKSGGREATPHGKSNADSSHPKDSSLFDEKSQQIQETVELLNQTVDTLNRDIEFNVLPEEGIVQARIKNGENGELLRAIPPDQIIQTRKKIDAFLGLFIDTLQ